VSSRPYPVYPSSMYNAMLVVDLISTKNISVLYIHSSNGFGLFRDINLGVDFFTLHIKL
jgi:hypothetical protein